jgi:hypothetical protein
VTGGGIRGLGGLDSPGGTLWRPLHSTACNALLKYRVTDGMDEEFRLGPGVGKVKVVHGECQRSFKVSPRYGLTALKGNARRTKRRAGLLRPSHRRLHQGGYDRSTP